MKLSNIYSQILKENYKPIIWYHGTNKNFKEFDLKYFGETDSGWWGYGIYFHSDKNRGGYGDIIKSVQLNFKKPLILPPSNYGEYVYNLISNKSGLPIEYKSESVMNIIRKIGNKNFTNILMSLGYDGMIIEYAQGTKEGCRLLRRVSG